MTFDSSNIMDFKSALSELRVATPGIPLREAAVELGTSEGELLASPCGEAVRRLDGNWFPLLSDLTTLGPLIILTRNEHAVLQSLASYPKPERHDASASAQDSGTQLSLHLEGWRHGFAVVAKESGQLRGSLQFFDDRGTAVHKVFLQNPDAQQAFETLVRRYYHEDQSPILRPIRGESLAQHATNRIPEGGSPLPLWRVDPRAIGGMLLEAASQGLSFLAYVTSPGARQAQKGPVITLQRTGPWLRILDPLFNLSLNMRALGSAWVAQEPDRFEGPYLLNLMDTAGAPVVELRSSSPDWNELLYTLPVWEA